jgi:hypothetical protein
LNEREGGRRNERRERGEAFGKLKKGEKFE